MKWDYTKGKIEWLKPKNPKSELYDVENDEIITKEDFYNSDVIDRKPENIQPNFGIEENGRWRFIWDAGEVEGFIEEEDFKFI